MPEFLSFCLSLCLLSVSLSLSVRLSVYFVCFVCLSVHPSFCLSVCQSLSLCLFVCLSVSWTDRFFHAKSLTFPYRQGMNRRRCFATVKGENALSEINRQTHIWHAKRQHAAFLLSLSVWLCVLVSVCLCVLCVLVSMCLCVCFILCYMTLLFIGIYYRRGICSCRSKEVSCSWWKSWEGFSRQGNPIPSHFECSGKAGRKTCLQAVQGVLWLGRMYFLLMCCTHLEHAW